MQCQDNNHTSSVDLTFFFLQYCFDSIV